MDELPPTAPKVTLKDIAQKLQLSLATVSLALHDHPKIPEQRRRQIQQEAYEMGYLPNTTAVALSQHRRYAKVPHTLPTLVWVSPAEEALTCELTAYWYAALNEAQRLGYHLEALMPPSGIASRETESFLRERHVAGLLFPPGQATQAMEHNPLVSSLPSIGLGPFAARSPVRLVTYDQLSDAASAFEHVRARGYRRVGLITDSTPSGALHQAGFLQARSKRPDVAVMPTLEFCERYPQSAVSWLTRHRPDALVFTHQGLSQKVRRSVPLPVGIGIALLNVPSNASQRLAGIHQNKAEIGRLAVRTLADQINERAGGATVPLCHVLVESAWADGRSLPLRT